MDIESIFRYSGEKMILEWKTIRASLEQSGDKGTALEKTVIAFLRPYLPKNLGITSGEITDSDGKLSHVFNYAEISFLVGIMSLFVSVTLILYMRLYPIS